MVADYIALKLLKNQGLHIYPVRAHDRKSSIGHNRVRTRALIEMSPQVCDSGEAHTRDMRF